MLIGSGTHVIYVYEHDFTEGLKVYLPSGEITFPCFSGDVIYWETIEIDESTNEMS